MDELSQFLYLAVQSPFGVVLDVEDFQLVQTRLYAARRKLNDPVLGLLQFRRSPYGKANELWIVKGGPALVPASKQDNPT